MKKNDIDTQSEIYSILSNKPNEKTQITSSTPNSYFNNENALIKKLQKRKINSSSMSIFQKMKSKLKQNIWFIFTICFTMIIYVGYIFIYINDLFANSNEIDFHFWLHLNNIMYRKAFIYFTFLHFIMFMWIYSMIYSMTCDPGVIDNEYNKYFNFVTSLNLSLTSQPNNKYLIQKLKELSDNKDEDNELIIQKILSNESFQDLFVNDLHIENKNDFFKFLYYTSQIEIESMKKNKRYCVFCKIIRPERCHHCMKCKRCVLRMDHHCNFLNICVGLKNYRPWLVFLFYSNSLFFFMFSTMIDGVRLIIRNQFEAMSQSMIHICLFIFCFGLACVGWISVTELYVTHLYFISRGVTTKEDRTETRTQLIVQNGGNGKGFINNFIDVFGTNVLYWFWPKKKQFVLWEGYIELKDETIGEYIVKKRNDFIMEWNEQVNTNNEHNTNANTNSNKNCDNLDNTNFIEIEKSLVEPL